MKREDVYKLIDGERAYQIERHKNHKVPHRDEDHSVADWITYIEYNVTKVKFWIYHLETEHALREIRKVTALGVACMEYNETPPRHLE